MNNQQFRRLLATSPTDQHGKTPATQSSGPPSSLGGKRSSFMPMTPRNVTKGGTDVDFARQVRDRNAGLRPTKKFKTAAPRGVKYAAGYTDRAKARAEADEAGDDKAERIKALEEQMKLGQIPEELFYSLRDEITGGDASSTHLVKGLDMQLLDRVRKGEDVLGTGETSTESEAPPDVDEELDRLEDLEVEAVKKEKASKKGSMAPPPVAGVKRSRNDIMADLKAQRKAADEAKAASALDASKWRKVGDKRSRIEVDHKGREVLITVDEDGVVKKKVRKVAARDDEDGHDMPDASKPVLGADAVPEVEAPTEEPEDEDGDIFEGVGVDYNPLGDEQSDSEDDEEDPYTADAENKALVKPSYEKGSASSDEEGELSDESSKDATTVRTGDTSVTQAAVSKQAAAPRQNYFRDTISASEEPSQDGLAGVQDLLKKAAKMDSTRVGADEDDAGSNEEQKARAKRRQEMLDQRDRDLEDMDMGFGGSRYDDGEEEGDGKKVRLSEWKGGADDGWEEDKKDGGKKKRKPKKRKGDANSMSDIMRVLDGRKGESGK